MGGRASTTETNLKLLYSDKHSTYFILLHIVSLKTRRIVD